MQPYKVQEGVHCLRALRSRNRSDCVPLWQERVLFDRSKDRGSLLWRKKTWTSSCKMILQQWGTQDYSPWKKSWCPSISMPHMANIGQEQPSIRNMQVVSSNRVHSTQSCEANKCRIFKPFFCISDKRFLNIIIKKKLRKINFKVRFLPLKIAFFGRFENDNILSSKSYTVTESGISSQRKLGS